MEIKVAIAMEEVCRELWDSFAERLRASKLLKIAVEAFHGQSDWFNIEEVI